MRYFSGSWHLRSICHKKHSDHKYATTCCYIDPDCEAVPLELIYGHSVHWFRPNRSHRDPQETSLKPLWWQQLSSQRSGLWKAALSLSVLSPAAKACSKQVKRERSYLNAIIQITVASVAACRVPSSSEFRPFLYSLFLWIVHLKMRLVCLWKEFLEMHVLDPADVLAPQINLVFFCYFQMLLSAVIDIDWPCVVILIDLSLRELITLQEAFWWNDRLDSLLPASLKSNLYEVGCLVWRARTI